MDITFYVGIFVLAAVTVGIITYIRNKRKKTTLK